MGKTVLPDGFGISEQMRSWAKEKAPLVDIDKEHEAFCDYWLAHGKKMADWFATWRNWMRRAPAFKGAVRDPVRLRTLDEIRADEAVQYAKH